VRRTWMMNGSVPLARPSKLPCSAYSTMSRAKHPRSPVRSGCSSAGTALAGGASSTSSLQTDAAEAPTVLGSELVLPAASILFRSPEQTMLQSAVGALASSADAGSINTTAAAVTQMVTRHSVIYNGNCAGDRISRAPPASRCKGGFDFLWMLQLLTAARPSVADQSLSNTSELCFHLLSAQLGVPWGLTAFEPI
jgi:hypothetical protein